MALLLPEIYANWINRRWDVLQQRDASSSNDIYTGAELARVIEWLQFLEGCRG